MSNNDKCRSYEEIAQRGEKEINKYLQQWASITDMEQIACEIYKDIFKYTHIEIFKDCVPQKNIGLLNYFLYVVLRRRARILNKNFRWNNVFKNQLLELNSKIKTGFNNAYKQANVVFDNLLDLVKNNNPFLHDFNLSIGLKPFILEPNKNDFALEERNDSIYYILHNMIHESGIWSDDIIINREDLRKSKKELKKLFNECLETKRYKQEDFEMNSDYLDKNFDCCCFGFAWCQLINCSFLSWYDILKINEIWVEVNVTHQNFIENIGKGIFWNDGIQSLSDNEAENIRNEYMSRLSKKESGLPAELLLDTIDVWDSIGPFKRIKFQGNKGKSDYWTLPQPVYKVKQLSANMPSLNNIH